MMIPMAFRERHHRGRGLRYSELTSYRCVRGRDRDRTAPLHLRAITGFSKQLHEKVTICYDIFFTVP